MAAGTRAAILTGLTAQAERVLVMRLRERGAVSAETAVPLTARERQIHRAALKPLVRRRIVESAGGTYWVNEAAVARVAQGQKHAQRNAVIALVLFTVVICIAMVVAIRLA